MNYLSYRLVLLKLQWRRDRENKILSKVMRVARKQGGANAEKEAYQKSEKYELNLVNDEIAYLRSRYYLSLAEKMLLPKPTLSTDSELWEKSDYKDRWYLSDRGITDIRGKIRIEKKEKRESIGYWATMLIGLIGAITGLIAVLKH